MAQMFPRTVPEYIARDKGRAAELRIYDLFAEQLPDKFACYYSRPWHKISGSGNERDGEADFVIAHPDLGILVIEVKGGRISCRPEDDQWISKDRHGIEYRIKNPVSQARSSKHRIIELMRQSKDWRPRYVNFRHGVILPDNARPQRNLAADAPLALFAFGDDLQNIDDWVTKRLGATSEDDRHAEPLGLDGMEALNRLLSSRFELRPHLARSLSDDVRQIERLTAEQFWVLDSLEDNAQMAVSGAAGTGKTVLALEKALRSAATGKRTLFVCYNSALAAHLKKIAGEVENLTVASFHSLCRTLIRLADQKIKEAASREFFDRVLPNAMLAAVDARPALKFEAIVIDEGQDFADDWLDILRLSLKNPRNDQFYVFHDDNQRIFSQDRAFLDALPEARYRLNKNLRNTRAIHRTLLPWYDSRKVISAGPDGEEVNWIECRDQQQSYAKAATIVAELTKSGQLAPSDIAVLSGQARDKCPLIEKGKIGGFDITTAEESGKKEHVCVDTVRRFKGLEAKCVIVVDPEYLSDSELVYVALSRGAVLLYILGTSKDLARLKGNAVGQ